MLAFDTSVGLQLRFRELVDGALILRGSISSLITSLITYPKVNVEVACAAEFAVSHLESNRHSVILVQTLVEALHAVGRQHNVVSRSNLEGYGGDEERLGRRKELHRAVCCEYRRMYLILTVIQK